MVRYEHDVDELKRIEETLRISEARYRSLFENAPDGILITDAEGRYLDANASMCRMVGYSRDELIGLNASKITDQLEMPGGSTDHREWQFRRRDGSVFGAEVISAKLPDGNVLGMVRDTTERRQAAEALREAHRTLEQRVIERTAQLEAANQELEAFSYSVSHDLRAPLRAINGFAGMVIEDFGAQLPEEGRRQLDRIKQASEQMGCLIDDLLAFSRLSRSLMNGRRVDTLKLVRDVLEELSPKRDSRQIEIRIGSLPDCYGDPALLKQVWVNLLSNAIKYSRGREPAIVEIGCRQAEGENVYFVRDNGTGFDMTNAHKLFGVFQRLHRADEFEGTGVGLAIVQRIVHRHGGRVWAEAEQGRGATFHFTLSGEQKR